MIAVGYSAMRAAPAATETTYAFDGQWLLRSGRVTEVFPTTGQTGQEHPYFQVDAALLPGMSGGPVVTVHDNSVPCVRGIVRSDESRVADPCAENPTPVALASMIWPLLLTPVTLPTRDGSVGGKRLLDLQREGLIIDRGCACEHIHRRAGDNGQIVEACWR